MYLLLQQLLLLKYTKLLLLRLPLLLPEMSYIASNYIQDCSPDWINAITKPSITSSMSHKLTGLYVNSDVLLSIQITCNFNPF